MKSKPELHDPKYWVLYNDGRYVQLGDAQKHQDGTFILARDPDKQRIRMLQKGFPGSKIKEMSAKEINKAVVP
jgi:hypothetical protein